MKISELTFQRNGVHGNSFFHCLASEPMYYGERMLITFETDEHGEVLMQTCRAVNLDNLCLRYRGDEIAEEVNNELKYQMLQNECDISRLCELI